MDGERRDLLLGLVEELLAQHRAWAESDTPYFTTELELALENVVAVWREGDLPGDCRGLARLIEDLNREYRAYVDRVGATGNTTLLPGRLFWDLLERLSDGHQAVSEPPRRQLESIEQLTLQKVPDRQICEMYGWIDRRGRAELWRLAEERAEPGKHTGADFVAPLERTRRERATRERALLARLREKAAAKAERAAAPPPESLGDLIAQDVSLRQLCEIFGRSEADLVREIQEQGLPMPRSSYDSPHAARGVHDPELPGELEAALDARVANPTRGAKPPPARRHLAAEPAVDEAEEADESPRTLEQQIVELHLAEMEAGEIAEQLSGDGLTVSPNKVRAVIGRYKKDPKAFG